MKIKSPINIFSYWIFTWFILYYFNFTKLNPLFLLILGLFSNLIALILLLLYKNYYKALLFIIVNTIIKIIPIYLIRNSKIKLLDIIFSIVFGVIFLLYLYFNKYSIKNLIDDPSNKSINTPFSYLIHKLILLFAFS